MQNTVERTRTLTMRFEEAAGKNVPLRRSLDLIMRAAQAEFNASGICLYELMEPDTLVLRGSYWEGRSKGRGERLGIANVELSISASKWLLGLHKPESITSAEENACVGNYPEMLLHQFQQMLVVPVRALDSLRGIITVGWRGTGDSRSMESCRLQAARLAEVVSSLLSRAREASAVVYLASKVARLESDLADEKIAERALGILTRPQRPAGILEALQDHVERVLGTTSSTGRLRQQVSELEATLRDRQLLVQAKAVLQHSGDLTEEEAYLLLRNESRRTRRPLRDIAGDVLRKPQTACCQSPATQ